MLKRLLMTASIAVTVALGGARADITVDDFKIPDPAVPYSLGTTVGSVVVDNSNLLNANRTITVYQNIAFPNYTGGVTGNINGGLFSMSTPTFTTGYAQLDYVLKANAADESAVGSKINFTVISSDHANVPFAITISDGTNTVTKYGTYGVISSPTTFTFDLHTDFAGLNLTNLQSVQLLLNKGNVAPISEEDTTINRIWFTNRDRIDPPVPAPAAAGLLIAGLPVLGLARVLRRKTA